MRELTARIACVATIGFILTMPAMAAPSILLNGDAESGDLTSWTTTNPGLVGAVTSQGQSTGTVIPFEGDYFFSLALAPARDSASDPAVTIDMFQTGTAGLGADSFSLTGWVQTETLDRIPDVGEVKLSFYDAGDALLAEVSSGPLTTSNLQWQSFGINSGGVAGAAYWRVDLLGTVEGGTYVNVFYDGVKLIANTPVVPVPGAVLLAGLGTGLVGWRRRRRTV